MKKQDYSKEYEQIVDNTRYVKIQLNEEMKKYCEKLFPTLKRWQNN